jgi:hypothetical protein
MEHRTKVVWSNMEAAMVYTVWVLLPSKTHISVSVSLSPTSTWLVSEAAPADGKPMMAVIGMGEHNEIDTPGKAAIKAVEQWWAKGFNKNK